MTPTIIKTDKITVETAPANGSDFLLAELNAIVGGPIEMIWLSDGTVMVLHGEGKFKDLDLNQRATITAGFLRGLQPGDWIAGDVLHCDADMIK